MLNSGSRRAGQPGLIGEHRETGHFDGAYLCFDGDTEITRCRGGELAETHHDDAIWAVMYFGQAREGSR